MSVKAQQRRIGIKSLFLRRKIHLAESDMHWIRQISELRLIRPVGGPNFSPATCGPVSPSFHLSSPEPTAPEARPAGCCVGRQRSPWQRRSMPSRRCGLLRRLGSIQRPPPRIRPPPVGPPLLPSGSALASAPSAARVAPTGCLPRAVWKPH